MYKLFVGFTKLGEFGSIRKAKRYARNCGMYGVFNLLNGKGYRDSWYVCSWECGTGKENRSEK